MEETITYGIEKNAPLDCESAYLEQIFNSIIKKVPGQELNENQTQDQNKTNTTENTKNNSKVNNETKK